MELVYLWVEDYKNIKRQGFNFSPRFECNYDEDIKKLTINKKEHIKDFFGENINVTAIVGENGSGKSRILECIEKIILSNGELEPDEFKYILSYCNEEALYMSNIEIHTSMEKETIFNDICTLAYRYHVSSDKIHQSRYFSSADLHYLTLAKQGIVNILSAKQDDMNSFHISSFMYKPVKVEISLKSYEELIQEHRSFTNFRQQDEIDEILKSITDPYHQYLSILYIIQKRLDLDLDSKILKDRALLVENTNNPLSQDDFSKFFISVITRQEFKLSEISQEQKDIYFHKNYWHYFEFDFIDGKKRRYNHLSHGEKVLYSQLLNIFFYINKNKKLLFLFDEPEIALHPNWQKQYLNEVINLLQKIPKKYHFIFTTHSPFLLSDLSSQNIIFLKKDKETGECINTTRDVNLNPFGANIHTLLSHGFFMQDGLMGEFAKSKINDVYKFLSDDKYDVDMTTDKAEQIIKIIGEPVLQKELQKLFDKNTHLDIDKQIKAHEDEIAKLKAKKEQ